MEGMVGTLSIRGLDNALTEELKKIANAEEKSVNQCVIDILKQQLGLTKQKKFTQSYDDLDQLFGSWSEGSFAEIEQKISSERQIDDELWK
jgi:plasmid stability protein